MSKNEALPVNTYYVNFFEDGTYTVMKVIGDEEFRGYVVIYRSNLLNMIASLDNKTHRHINKTNMLKILYDTEPQ